MASDHNIPDDLLPQILKLMPVKTLIKFQCVCKSWKSLLWSRFFTDVQLKYSTTKSGGAPTYLRQVHEWDTDETLYIIEQGNTRTNVDLPVLQSKRHFVMSLKVIHGVVCLAYALMNNERRVYNRKLIISFWNPIVRKHVTSSTPFKSDYNFIGFGFDASKNDFKAVWSPIKSIYREVFSARDGKWTKTKQPKCVDSLCFVSDSCFINGTIHWVTYKSNFGRSHGLVLFECEREEFTSIELPKLVGNIYGRPQVIEYRGLLSVIVSFCREDGIDWEFWTMNHESTWTKTHTYCNLWTSAFIRQLACDYKEIDLNMLDSSDDYVFKETMLLMDIGQSSQDTSVSFRPKTKRTTSRRLPSRP